jgi:DNA-binding HxlR family transcriptional regulator
MESEPKDVIILGSIRRGKKKFSNIQNETKISPEELNSILEELENRKFIRVEELKGWFGKKIELKITEDGSNELDRKIIEIQDKWKEMQLIYESGDKQKLQQKMEENKSFLPTMMFFGVMDMMMFSMMFSMMGIGMSDYVSQENMPDEDMGDEEYDFDIGF